MMVFCCVFSPAEINHPAGIEDMAAAMVAVGYSSPVIVHDALLARATISRAGTKRGASADYAPFLTIISDCRLDGREDLRAALAQDAPIEDDDDALIAAAFLRWGTDCPNHLIGDYSVVILDRRSNLLFAFRDHAGARPLFYSRVGSRLVLASDINAVLAFEGQDQSLDEAMVATTLSSRLYQPLDRTFYRNIGKLPPATKLSFRDGVLTLEKYWDPRTVAPVAMSSPEAYAQRLRELIEIAVRDRLRDCQKPGVHISGGLDSTAVAAIAVKQVRTLGLPEPVGFSWHRGFADDPPTSEAAWSEAARAHMAIKLIPVLPTSEVHTRLIRRDWTRNPDPRNLLHEEEVQIAAQGLGIDTIFSGWGGDQAVSYHGRAYHIELLLKGRWLHLWRELGQESRKHRPRAFMRVVRQAGAALTRRSNSGAKGLVNRTFLARQALRPIPRIRGTSVRIVQSDLLQAGAVGCRLEDWAISGSKRGITYVYPLLDRRVVEFVLGVPPFLFLHRGVSRWLMRAAARDLLPPIVADFAGKDEPLRTSGLAEPTQGSFGILHAEMKANRHLLTRAKYLEMDLLEEHLHRIQRETLSTARARIALQFLDFPDGGDNSSDPAAGELITKQAKSCKGPINGGRGDDQADQ